MTFSALLGFVKSLTLTIVQLPTELPWTIRLPILLRRCNKDESAKLRRPAEILNPRNREDITIGARSQLFCELQLFGHGGKIQIGEDCFVGKGTRIWSALEIRIGNRVLISHSVDIHDTNAHSLSAIDRAKHFTEIFSTGHPCDLSSVARAKIRIEDDAWIGFGSTILKGVTIGRGAVVAANSMVLHDVAPYTVVAGMPARYIKNALP